MADATHCRSQQIGRDPFLVFAEVVIVCQNNILLNTAALVEIVSLDPCQHSLRHSANQKVYTEIFYEFFMKSIIQRVSAVSLPFHVYQSIFIIRFQKLIKRHRIHKQSVYASHAISR